jgi:hypothetical protein
VFPVADCVCLVVYKIFLSRYIITNVLYGVVVKKCFLWLTGTTVIYASKNGKPCKLQSQISNLRCNCVINSEEAAGLEVWMYRVS